VDAEVLAPCLGISLRALRALDAGGHMPRPIRLGDTRRTLWSWPECRAWVRVGCPGREEWERLKAARRVRRAG
jgi:hypothetical protein